MSDEKDIFRFYEKTAFETLVEQALATKGVQLDGPQATIAAHHLTIATQPDLTYLERKAENGNLVFMYDRSSSHGGPKPTGDHLRLVTEDQSETPAVTRDYLLGSEQKSKSGLSALAQLFADVPEGRKNRQFMNDPEYETFSIERDSVRQEGQRRNYAIVGLTVSDGQVHDVYIGGNCGFYLVGDPTGVQQFFTAKTQIERQVVASASLTQQAKSMGPQDFMTLMVDYFYPDGS